MGPDHGCAGRRGIVAGKRSATEERADGARAFEAPHITIADELGADFLCADLGITSEPRADHAQYLDHWLGVMKADKKAIFAGASKACVRSLDDADAPRPSVVPVCG